VHASALLGVKLTGGGNNTFVQVGLVVMGLCKNAIPIVEFARELELRDAGSSIALEAAAAAPDQMTSVVHRRHRAARALGAGSEVRSVTGVTVFAGMLGVTLFGLFLTPVFYVGLRKLVERRPTVTQQVLPLEVGHA
jgi:multidrug efflux pump